jgi:type III pantothenate kinase
MSHFVAVLVGNTTAAIAVATRGTLGRVRRVPVGRIEALRAYLVKARRQNGIRPIPIVAASVNPAALEHLRLVAAGAAPGSHVHVARDDFPIPIRSDVDQPKRVGADRLLGALAALRQFHGACIVVDVGTAVTINAVSVRGVFVGGAIFPGLSMMARALAEGTALLPAVSPAARPPVIGKSTEAAIIAGIVSGAAGAICNLISAARTVVGPDARVILTGGDARRLAGFLPKDCRDVQPNLVLGGLVIAYREWKKR